VCHVEGELVDRDLAFLQLRGVAELEGGLTAEEDLVALTINNVDLLSQVEQKEPFGVAERDLHVA